VPSKTDKAGVMLSFYQDNEIAPVHQDTDDLASHFHRRQVLYQQLGLQPSAFRDRRVLEIGPGTGQNSLFVAAHDPSELVLVEPNPAGREAIESTFAPHPRWRDTVTVDARQIERFADPDGFDIVLCEGLVGASGTPDPTALVTSIAANVRPGGSLILTCTDYVAYVSEMLRRLLAFELSGDIEDVGDRTAALTPVFAPHLRSLPGFSRLVPDWIIDTLINPASVGELVSFADIIGYLGDDFEVAATSPRFVTDWTWYKGAARVPDFFNRTALESYWTSLHNFLDCRSQHPPRSVPDNRALMAHSKTLHRQIGEYERRPDVDERDAIVRGVKGLADLCQGMPTHAALAELLLWLESPQLDPSGIAASREFGTWFGRGQTYVSLAHKMKVPTVG
jgi:SAM-dependent methyltransferase